MKAILTRKGARRLFRPDLANKEVEITDICTMPWGARMASIKVHGTVIARSMQLYTPNHGKNCALIEWIT
jgi:hypothetical protein